MSVLDRRNAQRFPFSSQLEVRRQRPVASARTWNCAEVEPTPAVAVDVSTGGFGFRSPTPLQVGDFIAVTLAELKSEASMVPPAPETSLEIFAVVRHVVADESGYVIGAQRR